MIRYFTERDLEMWHRRREGATYRVLAEQNGICRERVRDICERIDRVHAAALAKRLPYLAHDPYVYNVWFHFGPGEVRSFSRTP